MELRYASHAVERMGQRKITTADVQQIIAKPDGVIGQTLKKSIYYKRIPKRDDNMLAIVLLELPERMFEVITVMNFFEARKE